MKARIVTNKDERDAIIQANFRGVSYFVERDTHYHPDDDLNLEEMSAIADIQVVECNETYYFLYSRYPNEFDWVLKAENVEILNSLTLCDHPKKITMDRHVYQIEYAPKVPLFDDDRKRFESGQFIPASNGLIPYLSESRLAEYGLRLSDVTPFVFLTFSRTL